ncbi:MAG: hypothetical protein Q8Q28_13100 [Pseudomonadota bacterium]|nr:hypothetical protein [Pseudomonadota bacterium]
MSDPTSKPKTDQPDALRRRLTQGGLAAPVVLATLLSKPVLGAAPHNCTISGQISGNLSTHEQGVCSTLGQTPAYYAALAPTTWPSTVGFNDWTTQFRKFSVDFPDAPRSFALAAKFKNAFEKVNPAPPNAVTKATVRDVLVGCVTKLQVLTECNPGWILRVKVGGGFLTDEVLALSLGRETLTACFNAIAFAPNFPLSLAQVVAMFNAVIVFGGTYNVAPGVNWNATQVRDYFASLHP